MDGTVLPSYLHWSEQALVWYSFSYMRLSWAVDPKTIKHFLYIQPGFLKIGDSILPYCWYVLELAST
jgi:hypothetical protein